MNNWKRRAFLGTAATAAGASFTWLKTNSDAGIWTAKAADIPDEILNPVEVYGADAVPSFGKLPGERRMYTLPAGQGEHHLIGSQVMTRVSRSQETAGVHEMVTFAGRTGFTRGWDTVLTRYQRTYPDQASMGHLEFSELEVRPLGPDATLVLGKWHINRPAGDVGGIFTLVLQKFPEGWRITHDHTTSN